MGDRSDLFIWLRRLTAGVCLAALAVGAGTGCGSTSPLDAPSAGKTISYAPGVPNFDVEILPGVASGRSGVDVHVSIPRMSLIFVQEGERYEATYELSAQVFDEEGERQMMQRSWIDSVRVASYEETQDYRPLDQIYRLDLGPGTYVFRLRLFDRNTRKEAVRIKRVTIPRFEGSDPVMTPLFLEAKPAGESYRTVAALHVRAGRDSLRVGSELYNMPPSGEVDVQLDLVRFQTDEEVAIPPYWLSPNRGSLSYQGIDYTDADTVERARYQVEDVGDGAELTFTLPADLRPGIYRITVRTRTGARGSEEDSLSTIRTRELSVKSSDFPTVAELDEVIDALEYIARESELERIRGGSSLRDRRRRFDAFWGELVESKARAADLIRQYYGRVEEANLFFTNYKEGWKTDRGMVYIVKGAPLFVEQYFEAEVWHYSYAQDPRQTYVFERVRPYRRQGVQFESYILRRRPYYERPWREAVERWRNGRVL